MSHRFTLTALLGLLGRSACSLALVGCLAVSTRGEDVPPRNPQAPANGQAQQNGLDTPEKQVSYIIGLNIGGSLQADKVPVDMNALVRGITDALADKDPLMTPEEIEAAMTAFQRQMHARALEEVRAVSEQNKKQGADFIAAYKQKEGVRGTQSGLQYRVLKAGAGATPTANDRVKVHYRGTSTDGEEFDSSIARGEPAVFPVGGVIRGWTEILQLMKAGDKWEVVIPSELAYGERGAPPKIGPNEVLVFEIELLEVNPR